MRTRMVVSAPPPSLKNWRDPKVSINPSTLTAVVSRLGPLVALVL